MGEFYEMFYDDAETASRVLGLTLTSRNNGGAAEVPLAGVPVKAAGDYLRRLVQQGFRVAICEQVEDPKLAKGIVRREVVETVTPGVAFADDLLDGARNNFIVAIAAGARACDARDRRSRRPTSRPASCGLIVAAAAELDPLLARWRRARCSCRADMPRCALPRVARRTRSSPSAKRGSSTSRWRARISRGSSACCRSMDSARTRRTTLAVGAAGALLRYLRELQPAGLPQLARPIIERPGGTMPLDEMTRRNLELVESLRGGGIEGTLLAVLDRTATPMGARLLRQWILAPLTDRAAIDARLDAVAALRARCQSRAKRCATRSTACATSSGLAAKAAARPRDAARARAHSAIRSARLPDVAAALRRVARRRA